MGSLLVALETVGALGAFMWQVFVAAITPPRYFKETLRMMDVLVRRCIIPVGLAVAPVGVTGGQPAGHEEGRLTLAFESAQAPGERVAGEGEEERVDRKQVPLADAERARHRETEVEQHG